MGKRTGSPRGRAGAGSFLALVLVFSMLGAGGAAAAPLGAVEPEATADHGWIVVLNPGHAAEHEAPGLAAQQGVQLSHVYTHALQGFAFTGSAEAADNLRRNPEVASVEPDHTVAATDVAPNGVLRIDAWNAHQAGYTGRTAGGTKVRAAILDTGIQSTHPDLAPNIATNEGKNCIGNGPPEDDHSHGTHVAGTVAAAFEGSGVVGVATDARLVAVKVLDSTGYGTDSQLICGIDWVVGLAADHVPTVINFSLGEGGRPNETACSASPLHQAVCGAVNAGVTVVAAAGNDGSDAAGFVPAAYPEVIAVSAHSDLDYIKNNHAGCDFDVDAGYICDDTMPEFSNYGSVVDVMAPGVRVYSTVNDGTWGTKSGTSMAAPHVTGVAALALAANPTLSPAAIRSLLERTGECPDGAIANGPTCVGHGQWTVSGLFGTHPDPDGIAEPLVNALAAAQGAGSPGPDTAPPTVTLTAPAAGALVHGSTTLAATAGDDRGVSRVDFRDGASLVGSDSTAPYSVTWSATGDGAHTITAQAFDAAGNSASDAHSVTVDNTGPAVVITSPSPDGVTVSGTVVVNADATDVNGVTKVEFLLDGALKSTDTSAGYAWTWDTTTATNGSHTLQARGTDAAGNVTTSAGRTVTVQNSSPSPGVQIHVAGLSGSSTSQGTKSWLGSATVTVRDQNGAVVSGATVTFSLSGGATGTVRCTTSSSGTCVVTKSVSTKKASLTFTVTGVTKTGTTYDSSANVVTAITVNKP
jgi:hypothetical protein